MSLDFAIGREGWKHQRLCMSMIQISNLCRAHQSAGRSLVTTGSKVRDPLCRVLRPDVSRWYPSSFIAGTVGWGIGGGGGKRDTVLMACSSPRPAVWSLLPFLFLFLYLFLFRKCGLSVARSPTIPQRLTFCLAHSRKPYKQPVAANHKPSKQWVLSARGYGHSRVLIAMTYLCLTTLYVSDEVSVMNDMHTLQVLYKRRQAYPEGAVVTGCDVFGLICRPCHDILVPANVRDAT